MKLEGAHLMKPEEVQILIEEEVQNLQIEKVVLKH
jgi:hypothetical protein